VSGATGPTKTHEVRGIYLVLSRGRYPWIFNLQSLLRAACE
jgi:hypothetical protein